MEGGRQGEGEDERRDGGGRELGRGRGKENGRRGLHVEEGGRKEGWSAKDTRKEKPVLYSCLHNTSDSFPSCSDPGGYIHSCPYNLIDSLLCY